MSNYPPGTPDLMGALADDGLSDFCQDYIPDDDQLAGWFTDDPDAIFAVVEQNNFKASIADFNDAWKASHEQEIEAEWDAREDNE